jgi:hypothetical protein
MLLLLRFLVGLTKEGVGARESKISGFPAQRRFGWRISNPQHTNFWISNPEELGVIVAPFNLICFCLKFI